jgi:hypothetical protein
MTILRSICVVACLTTCAPFAASGASYWTYTYKDIDVISSEGPESAKSTARKLSRLDVAITSVLRIEASDWRPPTHVYAMREAVFSRVRGKKDNLLSLYYPSPWGNTILINASNTRDEELYGAFFGYTGSVLLNAYSFRYPPWFVRGLSVLFGASVISKSNVTLGEARPERVQPILNRKLIPVGELLAFRFDDPQLKSPEYSALFDAESWLLVHLIVLEGKYHSNFFKYFRLRDQGEDEAKAFAASFDVTYEDLDKMLNGVIQGRRIQISKVAIPEDNDPDEATRLTDAQAAGRLAALAAIHGEKPDDVLQMANEAIALAPTNPEALFALAHVQIRRADFSAALEAADNLCSLDHLAENDFARCGQLFFTLANAVLDKKAILGPDLNSLRERSRRNYDRAITMDPGDVAAYEGMANLLAAMRNADYSQAFLPRVQKTLSDHPRAGSLARALSGMCAAMGNNVMALNYAVMWQNAAFSEAERDSAGTYVSRLKGFVDRDNLRNGAGSH